jgi:VanZ family protein
MMVTAALLEALQVFTPDRHADFYAALYGACGALTQALLAAFFIRVRAAYYRHRFLLSQRD